MTEDRRAISATSWILLLVLSLIWAGSFTANRGALAGPGPLTVVLVRVAGGAAILWLVVRIRGLPARLTLSQVRDCAAMGLLNNALPFTLIVWGQAHIASGLAAILNASTAIFTAGLAALLLPDERLTRARAAGLALGFLGVAMTVGPETLTRLDPTALGQLAVLAAAVSYALASIHARRRLSGLPSEVVAAAMMSAAAVMILPLALWREGLPELAGWPAAAWISLAYLAAASSALAYLLYFAILARAGAGTLGLVTLISPPAAVVLGALIFGERPGAHALAGFGLLACGLLVIDGRAGRLLARRGRESA